MDGRRAHAVPHARTLPAMHPLANPTVHLHARHQGPGSAYEAGIRAHRDGMFSMRAIYVGARPRPLLVSSQN